jgi:hypothetical protein
MSTADFPLKLLLARLGFLKRLQQVIYEAVPIAGILATAHYRLS